jgi:hypothetical protein
MMGSLFGINRLWRFQTMNTKSPKLSLKMKKVVVLTVAAAICCAIVPGFRNVAAAGNGTAFLGGMVAGNVLRGFAERSERRTRAEEYQAYGQPQASKKAPPAPAAQPTVQQRLDQLDKLAAGGYITPEEYKTRKKAILDGI